MTKLSKSAAIGATALLMSTSAMAADVKISGFVDFDTHITETDKAELDSQLGQDFYIPSLTPTLAGAGESFENMHHTAQSSRLRLSAKQDGITAFFELDFFGSAGNERVSNSDNPRLRRAFIKTDNLLMGQEWSTFQNLSAIPESASFLVASDAQVFVRQNQIRYTNGAFQIALEDGGRSRVYDNDSNTRSEHQNQEFGDIVLRYNHKADFGNVSVSYLQRAEVEVEEGVTVDGSGFNIAGRVKAGAGDVRFSYVSGEGLGRYVGLHATEEGYVDSDNKAHNTESTGHVIALRYPLGAGRINIGNSTLTIDNPAEDGRVEESTSSYVAYLWNPKPKLTYGVEYLTADLTKQATGAANEGNMTRMTFSAKLAF
ncbi:MAG: DcaP family trimeric outer membrane transporter [Parvibaculales bacterium]